MDHKVLEDFCKKYKITSLGFEHDHSSAFNQSFGGHKSEPIVRLEVTYSGLESIVNSVASSDKLLQAELDEMVLRNRHKDVYDAFTKYKFLISMYQDNLQLAHTS